MSAKGSIITASQTPMPTSGFRRMFEKNGIAHLDVDGCLVETEHVHVQSWIDLAKSCGVKLTDALFDQEHDIAVLKDSGVVENVRRPLRGANPAVIVSWIVGQMPADAQKPSLAAMDERFHEGFLKNKGMLRPREGIEDVVEDMYNNGWVIGTVTGSRRPIYEANLSALKKVPSFLDFSVTAEETTAHKPNPAPYVLGLKKSAELMGIEKPSAQDIERLAKRSFSIEDSGTGVTAALETPMPCVQFRLPHQVAFTKQIPARPLSAWVIQATNGEELWRGVNQVAGKFAPPAPKI